jgi:hypothetical protein
LNVRAAKLARFKAGKEDGATRLLSISLKHSPWRPSATVAMKM